MKSSLLRVAFALVVMTVMAGAPKSGASAAQDLALVPFPKAVTLEAGRFSLAKSLTFEAFQQRGRSVDATPEC